MSRGSHFRRLMDAPSAFCMRDLISLARADAAPSDLGRVYDWYSARTTKAIATSYAVAVLAGSALLKYANDPGQDWAAVAALVLVIVTAAFTGLFQLGELAQLPRELVEATRLLVRFKELKSAGVVLGSPTPPTDPPAWQSWWRWLLGLVCLCAGMVGGLAHWTDHDSLEIAVAAIACAVAIPFVRRVILEFAGIPDLPDTAEDVPLIERIGDVRLDTYLTNQVIAGKVNACIDEPKPPASD